VNSHFDHSNQVCISEEVLQVSPQRTLALVVGDQVRCQDLFESSADDFYQFSIVLECQLQTILLLPMAF
jgi:hypothetical protein